MSSLPFQYLLARGAAMMAIALLLGGCVNATVDEMTYNEPVAGIGESRTPRYLWNFWIQSKPSSSAAAAVAARMAPL